MDSADFLVMAALAGAAFTIYKQTQQGAIISPAVPAPGTADQSNALAIPVTSQAISSTQTILRAFGLPDDAKAVALGPAMPLGMACGTVSPSVNVAVMGSGILAGQAVPATPYFSPSTNKYYCGPLFR